jgi:hypothetical protein
LQNHTHLIAAKQPENMEKSVELEFLLYRQVYQSDFIAKCMSYEGFLARRGVLELAT